MRIVQRTVVPTSISSDEVFLAEMTAPDQSARFSRLLIYAKISSAGRLMKTLCSNFILFKENLLLVISKRPDKACRKSIVYLNSADTTMDVFVVPWRRNECNTVNNHRSKKFPQKRTHLIFYY